MQSWPSGKTLSDSHGESCGAKSRPETLDRGREKEEAKKAVFARAMEMVEIGRLSVAAKQIGVSKKRSSWYRVASLV